MKFVLFGSLLQIDEYIPYCFNLVRELIIILTFKFFYTTLNEFIGFSSAFFCFTW
jgi:hypothetical protein